LAALPVGLDVVAGLGRVRLRRTEALGEPDDGDADRTGGERRIVREQQLRQPERRQTARDRTDDGHPALGQVQQHRGQHPGQHHDHRRREQGGEPPKKKQQHQRTRADGDRPPFGMAQLGR
jgi:hypothetical protein